MFPQLISPRMRGLSGLFRGPTGVGQFFRPTDSTVSGRAGAASRAAVLTLVANKSSLSRALMAYGADSTYAADIEGSPTSGLSYGVIIRAGTTSADVAALVRNQADSADYIKIFGDGHGTLGPSATLGLSWDVNGHMVVAAPGSAGAALSLPAGTTTVYPLLVNSGTNLTTPVAGGVEFDGTALYFTPAASSRAVNLIEYVEVMSGTKTLVSQTAAQAILNGTTNGAVTLPIGTYEFDCFFSLTALSATSGAFGFALGGTATFTQAWWALADKAALTTPTAPQMTFDTAANTLIATGTVATVGYAQITGIIRVTVAGTVIPQVSQTTAAAAVVGANSFARFRVVGSATVQSVGNWS